MTAMKSIPRSEWPKGYPKSLTMVFQSDRLLVQVHGEDRRFSRLSVIRCDSDSIAAMKHSGRWADGITWDELQVMKNEIGLKNAWLVEVYPPASEVVDVANVRHLWLVPRPDFAWVPSEGKT